MKIDIATILISYITYPAASRLERIFYYNLMSHRQMRLSGVRIIDGILVYYRDSYGISRDRNKRRYKYGRLHGVCRFANEYIIYRYGMRHLFAYIPCHNPRFEEYELYIYYRGYQLYKIECYCALIKK